MPNQIPESERAIRSMEEARQRLFDEAMDVHNSDDYKNQRDDARERYRRLREKHENLRAVIRALQNCEIR